MSPPKGRLSSKKKIRNFFTTISSSDQRLFFEELQELRTAFEASGNSDPIVVYGRSVFVPLFRPILLENSKNIITISVLILKLEARVHLHM